MHWLVRYVDAEKKKKIMLSRLIWASQFLMLFLDNLNRVFLPRSRVRRGRFLGAYVSQKILFLLKNLSVCLFPLPISWISLRSEKRWSLSRRYYGRFMLSYARTLCSVNPLLAQFYPSSWFDLGTACVMHFSIFVAIRSDYNGGMQWIPLLATCITCDSYGRLNKSYLIFLYWGLFFGSVF